MYGTYVCVYIYIALVRMVRTIFAVLVHTGTVRNTYVPYGLCDLAVVCVLDIRYIVARA